MKVDPDARKYDVELVACLPEIYAAICKESVNKD